MALIAGTLLRDGYRAWRNRKRAEIMDQYVRDFTGQPAVHLVREIGDPYEISTGTSGRSLYTWKSPPNHRLPRGTGLLTVVATIESTGLVSELAWRDRT